VNTQELVSYLRKNTSSSCCWHQRINHGYENNRLL